MWFSPTSFLGCLKRASSSNASICNRPSSAPRRLSCRSREAVPTRQHVGMESTLPRIRACHGLRRAYRGVTLIELMVGVVVLSIILMFAVPSFRGAIASNRLTTSTNELVSAVALARSEAIRRGARVTICKSADGAACTTAGGWQQGWIVFTDTTRATFDPSVDAGESVIVVARAHPAGVQIQGTAAVANYLSFAADGTVRTMTGTPLTGRLQVCSTSGSLTDARRVRELSVSSAGRLASSSPSTSAACEAPT